MSTWYEKWPKRLELENFLMEKYFPKLQLKKLDDGRLVWEGELYSNNGISYRVSIVYPPEYPQQSPRAYPISDYSDGTKSPFQIMKDGSMCLSYPKFDSATITAVHVASSASLWIRAFEVFINTGNFPELDESLGTSRASESILIQNYGTMVNTPIQQGNERTEQTIIETNTSDNIQDLLKQLTQEVEKLSEIIPNETAREIKQDLSVLQAESTSKNPRKKWCELSADGLIKAATNLGTIGKPVIELVSQILIVLKGVAR